MASLDTCPNGERAFEDGLCGLVFVVPGLELVTKEEFDALDVHLPRRVQPGVVDVRQETNSGGEVARESNWPIEHILVSLRETVGRRGTFDLEVGSREVQQKRCRVYGITLTLSQNVPLFLLKTGPSISSSLAPACTLVVNLPM